MPEFRFDSAAEFPEGLKGEYRCLSCLKAGQRGMVYLCERVAVGDRVIVKIVDTPDQAELLRNEYLLLGMIEASGKPAAAGFPRAIACRAIGGGRTAFIRTHVAGQSIESLVESRPDRPGLESDRAVALMISALDQLAFLHDMKPPVIHRDIKPQNVVVDDGGSCHLIDLGISRIHRAGEDMDTNAIGTRLTAPPEQFGYRQTDERSDIYSMGVLLRYCVTGEYGEAADDLLPSELRRVVKRATQFDPQRRYRSAREMRGDLAKLQNRGKSRRTWLAPFVAAIVVLAAAAALLLARHPKAYIFKEPLIEQAVRETLGMPEGALTAEALSRVERLHIFGKQVCASDDDFWFLGEYVMPRDPAIADAGLWAQNGGIKRLDDLAALPNLRELGLYRQDIADIASLKGMKLTALGLGYNPLTDIAPLRDIPTLTALNLSGLAVDDLGPILALPLRVLEISGTRVSSLGDLTQLPLRTLNLFGVPARDYDALTRMPNLDRLTLGELNPVLAEAVKRTGISALFVTHSEGTPLEALDGMTGLTDLYYYADEPYTLTDAPLSLPDMRWIDLKNVRLESMNCLGGMKKLRILNLYAAECLSYEGLDSLPELEAIYCTAEQAEAIDARYPGHGWRLETVE